MKFTISAKPLKQIANQTLVLFSFSDAETPEEKQVNREFDGLVAKLKKTKDFTGKLGSACVAYPAARLKRLLLVGLGKKNEFNLAAFQKAIDTAAKKLKNLPDEKVSVLLPSGLPKLDRVAAAAALSQTFLLSAYEFNDYKSQANEHTQITEVELLTTQKTVSAKIKDSLLAAEVIGRSVVFARNLGNHPGNAATPALLARHALNLAKENKALKVKVLGRKQVRKERMNALLAVAAGSEQEPKFIILEYRPRAKGKTVVLIGKGITFDSGGLSIKPAEKMEEMKFDMAGAATVMAIVQAAAALKLPVNLIGLVPATENLPSGRAMKPGDIVKSRSGKTIEIISTDAEGRMVLADALDYAKSYQPDLVIDFATLTGAIVVALGDELIGAFTNRQALLPKLERAAELTGEKVWPMPLEPEYKELIKSDFADLRNIAAVRYGDAINAALFLQHFVSFPWIHLDIAGVAWATREKPYRPKGATGTGVRLMIEFLKNLKI